MANGDGVQSGSTWIRWGLGIVATVLILTFGSMLGWIISRQDRIQQTLDDRAQVILSTSLTAAASEKSIARIAEQIDRLVATQAQLTTETALLRQEMILGRTAWGRRQ